MQRVQSFIFTPLIVFVWRFTRRRVLLAILEWERVFPTRGPRSHASQRRAIVAGEKLSAGGMYHAARSLARVPFFIPLVYA